MFHVSILHLSERYLVTTMDLWKEDEESGNLEFIIVMFGQTNNRPSI